MRMMMTTIVIAVLAAACSSTSSSTTTTTFDTPENGQTTSTAVKSPASSQLSRYDVQRVQVGDRALLLAIADNPGLRRQGLKRVTDLGELDGMLFFWRHDGDSFSMQDTLIPLDIVWFNEDGTYKDRASMVPCTEDPCPTYAPDDFDFRFAIEALPGTLDWITPDTVIVYSD